MSGARYTKDGLLIPAGWLKGLGRDVRIQRGSHVVIIESKQRQSARRRLTQLVKKLRQASQEAGRKGQVLSFACAHQREGSRDQSC